MVFGCGTPRLARLPSNKVLADIKMHEVCFMFPLFQPQAWFFQIQNKRKKNKKEEEEEERKKKRKFLAFKR